MLTSSGDLGETADFDLDTSFARCLEPLSRKPKTAMAAKSRKEVSGVSIWRKGADYLSVRSLLLSLTTRYAAMRICPQNPLTFSLAS
jgi:hypothetical protein